MTPGSSTSVAVVIPAHNAAPWLARALDSVLAQTHALAEVFLIDDASTDDTAAIAARYAPRVSLHSAVARGSNPARNLGLRLATSTWIEFLDADDFFRPEKTARQLAVATDARADLVYSPSLLIAGTGATAAASSPIAATDDPIESFLEGRGFQTGAMLWRREALLALGGWNESFPRCQDYELASRALRAGVKLAWSPHADAAYCLHDGTSLSRARPLATIQGMVALLEEFCGWLKAQHRFDARYAEIARRRLLAFLWAASHSDAEWAVASYRRLATAGLVQPRWFASKLDTCLALAGWDAAIRLRRAFGARSSP